MRCFKKLLPGEHPEVLGNRRVRGHCLQVQATAYRSQIHHRGRSERQKGMKGER